ELIGAGLPASMLIGGLALLLALVVGLLAGSAAALCRDRWQDHLLMTFSTAGISIPNYVMAPLLVLLFAIALDWLPAGGWNDAAPANLLLPVVVLALPQTAYIARMMRASLAEVL